ncbi:MULTISPECIES: (2Fe-2S)-binding protein [unclassified Undibacterium]|uniref:(2Fe-2S)-binding protein n=1 Tax=unclassified Undibacterium TaxID=2630295 RepID=UPI002AC96A4D|nr:MULTISPECIES: (2Fe-2S)-binding protein [unclassified Undibacterium]MEB0139231.1 (2Fe-2S)-binding protein [Undibacterium sp. CCC2.1]MEB0172075.1 (2Fe-2S)-binding protein [Undibacterium sp. CCC1.1]MEB0175950.1 (2Fe-2S)-binding protein [Undibacterium sp. CCC3.4]MEB0215262.1 (2Fe-2S)-binding protein [Undibacterium sp. 5I2]WPX45437.1 (2Fe-2S)-binding protein [Undibacterium sp. CCC3.4]
MIVCVCNNISERQIASACAAGHTTMADLRHHLQVGTCCGKCAGCARKVLRECNENSALPAHVIPLVLQRRPLSGVAA